MSVRDPDPTGGATPDPVAVDNVDLPQTPDVPRSSTDAAWLLVGLALVVSIAWLVKWLERAVPRWFEGTALADLASGIEYPVYAIILGLTGSWLLGVTGLRERLSGAFRTEFFIKTGLVLLGASINFSVIVRAAGPSVAQALIVVTSVLVFAYWLGGKLGLDDKLRALLATAVSICGVSAAIAAAGAVQAKKEQLAYAASLVIAFALPSIFLVPWLAGLLGLSDEVAGAWIGGNIDTTAAVTAAGALAGETALQIATIVKSTQNALMGVVAVGLTAYFAFHVDRTGTTERPKAIELWHRFPKFVLGFLVASIVATVYSNVAANPGPAISAANGMRTWFLVLAFVSIGLEFRISALREAGWRPITVFGTATAFNLVVALTAASILFRGVSL